MIRELNNRHLDASDSRHGIFLWTQN